jgi:plasmid stabilization system protein ParE
LTAVATLELAPEITEDFDRIFEHFADYNPDNALERITEIIEGLDFLSRHPMIGRPVAGSLRELVLGTKKRGYLALYRYSQELEIVFILAIRSQREAGYVRQDSM